MTPLDEQFIQSLMLRAPDPGAKDQFAPLMREAMRLQNEATQRAVKQPDTSGYALAGHQRELQGRNDIAAGLAMATALPEFRQMAQQTHGAGLEALQPMQMGEGTYFAGRGYVPDPYKQQDRLTKAMASQAGAASQFAGAFGEESNRQAQQEDRKLQRAHQQLVLDAQIRHQRAMEGNAGGQLSLARQQFEFGKIQQVEDAMGNKTYVRVTPQGVVPLPVQGQVAGAPSAQQADILPKNATSEARNKYLLNAEGLALGAQVLDQLKDPKLRGEFGFWSGLGAQVQAGTGIPVAGGTAQQQQLRAMVMQRAYEVINKLAGAALSKTEETRIMQFAPGARDSAEAIEAKLNSAIEIARETRSVIRRSHGMPDVERFGATPSAPGAAPGATAANPGAPYGWKQ